MYNFVFLIARFVELPRSTNTLITRSIVRYLRSLFFFFSFFLIIIRVCVYTQTLKREIQKEIRTVSLGWWERRQKRLRLVDRILLKSDPRVRRENLFQSHRSSSIDCTGWKLSIREFVKLACIFFFATGMYMRVFKCHFCAQRSWILFSIFSFSFLVTLRRC